MKVLLMAMGAPALMLAVGMAIAGTPAEEQAQTRALNLEQAQASRAPQVAEAAPVVPLGQMTALNQIGNVPEIVATARVTDAQGKVIGAVQKVEIQDGNPSSVDIALLGGDGIVTLDAATLRYDAAANVVAVNETLPRLMARSGN